MNAQSIWELAIGLSPAFCWLLAMALFHTLWQAAILGLVVAVACWGKSKLNVHQKYAVAFTGLMLIALSPIVNFLWLANSSSAPAEVQYAHRQFTDEGRFLPLFELNELASFEAETPSGALDSGHSLNTTPAEQAANPISETNTNRDTQSHTGRSWVIPATAIVTLIYGLGVCLMISRLCLNFKTHWRLASFCKQVVCSNSIPEPIKLAAERAAESLGRSLRTPVAMFQGEGIAMVIGCLRPVILVNSALVSGLTPIQLEQIIAHELAHVFRFDPLAQLLQRLTESVLFFHPATWYVSRKVSELREMCCDELVANTHCRIEYADTLLLCAAMHASNPRKTDSQFSLAASGSGAGQLTTRIESLILNQPSKPLARQHRSKTKRSPFLLAGFSLAAFAVAIVTVGHKLREIPPEPSQSSLATIETHETTAKTNAIPKWKWKRVDPQQVKSTAFLFDGNKLQLSNIPSDVEINAMVDKDNCKFAQWHFGDISSTRASVLLEIENGKINRVFLDANRDRIIQDGELVTERTSNQKTWLADFSVEVRDNDEQILAGRQIGITPNLKKGSVKITTLGYSEGEIEFAGRGTLVRRIDRDGNGLPNENQDQIWFDLDHDGTFNLINERFDLRTVLDISGQRYLIRSDRLGQSLGVTPINEQGSVRFVFNLADKEATLIKLQGSLRDEHGMLIAIRPSEKPVAVPAGRYCIENLVVEAKDSQDSTWKMTLLRGFDSGWFEIKTGKEHELNLLESFSFIATPVHKDNGWSKHMTQLEPRLHTPNGLVVTNFTKNNSNQSGSLNDSVSVHFEVAQAGVPQPETKKCQSGFF